jgi:NhaP-type Na+/H+ and K+/H+ antiporter
MSRPRYSVPLRTLALLVLLWVGLDIGAHGLFASDFPPIAGNSFQLCVSQDDGGATECAPTDHCFCHSLSTAAMRLMQTAGLTQVGAPVLDPPRQVPHSHPHPVDRPPQPVA